MDVSKEAVEPRPEKAYVRHAWMLLAVLPLFHLGFGAVLLLAPAAFLEVFLEPSVPSSSVSGLLTPESINHAGAHLGSIFVGWAFMAEAVTVYGYRRGEKWAWTALWYLPILYGYDALLHLPSLTDVALPFFFLGVAVLGLLLPFRKFFPSEGRAEERQ